VTLVFYAKLLKLKGSSRSQAVMYTVIVTHSMSETVHDRMSLLQTTIRWIYSLSNRMG